MKTISSIELQGSTFNFEPPVPMRDDEPSNPSLARVATFAWYGAEHPYGMRHDLAEGRFQELIDDNTGNPQALATALTTTLQIQTEYNVTWQGEELDSESPSEDRVLSLVSQAGMARALGVSQQRVHQLRLAGALPLPFGILDDKAGRMVWTVDQVTQFTSDRQLSLGKAVLKEQ